VYAQSRVKLSSDVSLLAGLRWNRTTESRHIVSGDEGDPLDQSRRDARPSGSFGGLWEVWRDRSGDLDDVSIYASLGNTFQAPQLDFGTEAGDEPLLKAETQRSVVAGVKADGDDGRFDVDISAFLVDFANQPVAREIDGSPVLQSGGRERFKGVEVEASFRPLEGLSIAAHASYGEARYRGFTTLIDDTLTSLDGGHLALTPKVRAGAAVIFAPQRGLGFSVTANYTGSRYLDELNRNPVRAYTTLDASIAYRFDHSTLSLAGSNLTNRRDPVLTSELGEGQIYRMPGRRLFARWAVDLD
jgi:iron complex outermembrane recepter protein